METRLDNSKLGGIGQNCANLPTSSGCSLDLIDSGQVLGYEPAILCEISGLYSGRACEHDEGGSRLLSNELAGVNSTTRGSAASHARQLRTSPDDHHEFDPIVVEANDNSLNALRESVGFRSLASLSGYEPFQYSDIDDAALTLFPIESGFLAPLHEACKATHSNKQGPRSTSASHSSLTPIFGATLKLSEQANTAEGQGDQRPHKVSQAFGEDLCIQSKDELDFGSSLGLHGRPTYCEIDARPDVPNTIVAVALSTTPVFQSQEVKSQKPITALPTQLASEENCHRPRLESIPSRTQPAEGLAEGLDYSTRPSSPCVIVQPSRYGTPFPGADASTLSAYPKPAIVHAKSSMANMQSKCENETCELEHLVASVSETSVPSRNWSHAPEQVIHEKCIGGSSTYDDQISYEQSHLTGTRKLKSAPIFQCDLDSLNQADRYEVYPDAINAKIMIENQATVISKTDFGKNSNVQRQPAAHTPPKVVDPKTEEQLLVNHEHLVHIPLGGIARFNDGGTSAIGNVTSQQHVSSTELEGRSVTGQQPQTYISYHDKPTNAYSQQETGERDHRQHLYPGSDANVPSHVDALHRLQHPGTVETLVPHSHQTPPTDSNCILSQNGAFHGRVPYDHGADPMVSAITNANSLLHQDPRYGYYVGDHLQDFQADEVSSQLPFGDRVVTANANTQFDQTLQLYESASAGGPERQCHGFNEHNPSRVDISTGTYYKTLEQHSQPSHNRTPAFEYAEPPPQRTTNPYWEVQQPLACLVEKPTDEDSEALVARPVDCDRADVRVSEKHDHTQIATPSLIARHSDGGHRNVGSLEVKAVPSEAVEKGSKGNYECTECHRLFSSRASLTRHRKTHIDERPHVCNLCGKAFAQPEDLQRHTRLHNPERPYECTYCNKRFTTRANARVHERCHTGVRPYTCLLCGESFAQISARNNHVRTHTKERPFVCGCSKAFGQAATLKAHQNRMCSPLCATRPAITLTSSSGQGRRRNKRSTSNQLTQLASTLTSSLISLTLPNDRLNSHNNTPPQSQIRSDGSPAHASESDQTAIMGVLYSARRDANTSPQMSALTSQGYGRSQHDFEQ